MWYVVFVISLFAFVVIFTIAKQSRKKTFDETLKETELKLSVIQAQNRDWEQKFNTLMGYQAAGREFEKQNDIENAIIQYKMAVTYGSQHLKINNYYHSVERLLILYRKKKDFESELALIETTLKEGVSDKDREALNYRKERVLNLKNKKR